MKYLGLVILLHFYFGIFTGYSQTFGPRQIIQEDPGTVRMARSADFDGDDDMDVVIAANNLIAWYENLDGLGNFGEPISIQEGMSQSQSLYPTDIDNDQITDLVVAYFDLEIVGWYKNLGNGTFGPIQIINEGIFGTFQIECYDLDGDIDTDVILGLANSQGLYWFENSNGDGTSWNENIIDATIQEARSQAVGDIDGDNDLDILTNSVGNVYVSWYPNLDGNGNFGTLNEVDTVGLYENSVNLVDLDGDEDLDILSQKTNEVIWRENIDGMGNFSTYNLISDQAFGIYQVIAVDVDNDFDFDVVSISTDDNKVAWYENLDGLANFGPQQIIDANLFAPRTVHAADLDGDGDMDIISAALSSGNHQLVWYENLTILGIDSDVSDKVIIVPNPVEDSFSIQSQYPISNVRILETSGKSMMEVSEGFENISLKNLQSGMYLVEIQIEHHKVVKKLVKQ